MPPSLCSNLSLDISLSSNVARLSGNNPWKQAALAAGDTEHLCVANIPHNCLSSRVNGSMPDSGRRRRIAQQSRDNVAKPCGKCVPLINLSFTSRPFARWLLQLSVYRSSARGIIFYARRCRSRCVNRSDRAFWAGSCSSRRRSRDGGGAGAGLRFSLFGHVLVRK
jgi:hypothetical protein